MCSDTVLGCMPMRRFGSEGQNEARRQATTLGFSGGLFMLAFALVLTKGQILKRET